MHTCINQYSLKEVNKYLMSFQVKGKEAAIQMDIV